MNERIYEALKQVGAVQNVLAMGRHDGVLFTETELEKFAELIVRECIDIAQDRAAFDWAPPNDVNHIINEIKERFGVEK
jgi:hypothetical protein